VRLSETGQRVSSGGAALIKCLAEVEPEGEGAPVKRHVPLTRAGGGGGHMSPPNSHFFHSSSFPKLVLDDMAYEGRIGALGQELS
jgi:hypothetical protein